MNNVFFDFDGTLLDSRMRLYQLFIDIVSAQKTFTFDEYWNLKRQGFGHKKILIENFNFSAVDVDRFTKIWMNKIEDEKYLALDYLYEDTMDILNYVKSKNYTVSLVTNRQNITSTHEQLNRLKIHSFFDNVLITEHKVDKIELINDSGFDLVKDDIIVGDCGHDIKVGNSLGIRSVGITHGFQSEKLLSKYNPNIIIINLLGLKKHI